MADLLILELTTNDTRWSLLPAIPLNPHLQRGTLNPSFRKGGLGGFKRPHQRLMHMSLNYPDYLR